MADDEPEQGFWKKALEDRRNTVSNLGGYSYEDFQKASSYSVDGFGDMYEYLMSNYMEILEFFGDYCDSDGNLETNRIITVVDRSEEHTSELQSLMRISYAVFCLKKKIKQILN